MLETPITCPRCHSNRIVKNRSIHNGNHNFKCKDCSRQFVQNPTKKVIGQAIRDLKGQVVVREAVIGRNCQSHRSQGAQREKVGSNYQGSIPATQRVSDSYLVSYLQIYINQPNKWKNSKSLSGSNFHQARRTG